VTREQEGQRHDDDWTFRVDLNAKTLKEVEETDLASLGLRERYDLQEWIEKNPEILGEELLIVAKECNSFDSTSERTDLVALDRLGNLVVIELKRDDSGTDAHWQAVKYASYFAKAKPDVIVELLAKHDSIPVEQATKRVLGFVGQDDLGSVNREQRIILVSHRFAREVTSAVLWLRDHGVDLSCIQLTPYADSISNALYMQATTIIPVPGTDGYKVTAESPISGTVPQTGRGKKEDDVTAFLRRVADEAKSRLNEAIRPDKTSRWAGQNGTERYFNIWYRHAPWQPYCFQYKLCVYDGENGVRVLSVGLDVSESAAQRAGLDAVQIVNLKDLMRQFGNVKDAAFWEGTNKWIWCGFNLSAASIDDSLRVKATEALQALIEHFSPAIEKLFETVNQQQS
jgi:hypothetical protein